MTRPLLIFSGATLFALAISCSSPQPEAKQSRTYGDMVSFAVALESYRAVMGHYPDGDGWPEVGGELLQKGFLRARVDRDGWGGAYQYSALSTENRNSYELRSCASDGECTENMVQGAFDRKVHALDLVIRDGRWVQWPRDSDWLSSEADLKVEISCQDNSSVRISFQSQGTMPVRSSLIVTLPPGAEVDATAAADATEEQRLIWRRNLTGTPQHMILHVQPQSRNLASMIIRSEVLPSGWLTHDPDLRNNMAQCRLTNPAYSNRICLPDSCCGRSMAKMH